MIYQLADPGQASALLGNWTETIIWSCLQGVMGTVYADAPFAPRSAAAVLGDFCFLAGVPLPELVEQALQDRSSCILIPRDNLWDTPISPNLWKPGRLYHPLRHQKGPGNFRSRVPGKAGIWNPKPIYDTYN